MGNVEASPLTFELSQTIPRNRCFSPIQGQGDEFMLLRFQSVVNVSIYELN